ncbi:MAG: ATP-binding protein [Roseimicrobium sp.]
MLHRIVDGIDDGLFIVGQDLRVAFVNRSAELFFPPVRDPVGRTLLECVRDHRIVELVSEAVEQGQRARQEFLVSSSSAGLTVEDHVFSVEAIPLNGDAPEGLEGALLVILRDETEKHTLEKIRKDFVANASHELRTPLSIINGYLENLTDGDISEPQEAKRAFNIMRKHGDRLARIIEDLLVISRMESGAPDAVKKECFDLKACAEDVIHRLTPMMTTKEARVTVLLDDGASPMIYGDRYYWDQILFNLVSNALKENPARGLEVIISLKQQADMSEIQVRDNGVGIPHADLPFVFKRFYRVRRHYGTEVKGTGLGLSIVKRAVEAHQGKITLHSKPGIETVFTIRVPREPCGAPGLSLTTA